MIACDKCDKKFVRKDFYEIHYKAHDEPIEAPVEVKIEIPEVSNDVVLEFARPVEIYINSVPYLGKRVTAPNMSIASEIVRIAREAYGRDIMLV